MEWFSFPLILSDSHQNRNDLLCRPRYGAVAPLNRYTLPLPPPLNPARTNPTHLLHCFLLIAVMPPQARPLPRGKRSFDDAFGLSTAALVVSAFPLTSFVNSGGWGSRLKVSASASVASGQRACAADSQPRTQSACPSFTAHSAPSCPSHLHFGPRLVCWSRRCGAPRTSPTTAPSPSAAAGRV